MEEKIEIRKDIIKKLLKGNLILAGTKVGVSLIPQLSIIGFIVPQYFITVLVLLFITLLTFKKEKVENEWCYR